MKVYADLRRATVRYCTKALRGTIAQLARIQPGYRGNPATIGFGKISTLRTYVRTIGLKTGVRKNMHRNAGPHNQANKALHGVRTYSSQNQATKACMTTRFSLSSVVGGVRARQACVEHRRFGTTWH